MFLVVFLDARLPPKFFSFDLSFPLSGDLLHLMPMEKLRFCLWYFRNVHI